MLWGEIIKWWPATPIVPFCCAFWNTMALMLWFLLPKKGTIKIFVTSILDFCIKLPFFCPLLPFSFLASEKKNTIFFYKKVQKSVQITRTKKGPKKVHKKVQTKEKKKTRTKKVQKKVHTKSAKKGSPKNSQK